jgi:hypothetical protein
VCLWIFNGSRCTYCCWIFYDNSWSIVSQCIRIEPWMNCSLFIFDNAMNCCGCQLFLYCWPCISVGVTMIIFFANWRRDPIQPHHQPMISANKNTAVAVQCLHKKTALYSFGDQWSWLPSIPFVVLKTNIYTSIGFTFTCEYMDLRFCHQLTIIFNGTPTC